MRHPKRSRDYSPAIFQVREDIKIKNFSIRALPELPKPPPPNSGNFTDFFPANKNDVLRVWRKKILMMIIIVAMIILIKILVILMIMITKMTERPIVNIE